MTRLIQLLDERAQLLELQALQLEEQAQRGSADGPGLMLDATADRLAGVVLGLVTVSLSEALRKVAAEGDEEEEARE
jgi:hypothetical protein